MTEYDVILIIFALVAFVLSILSYVDKKHEGKTKSAKEDNKETNKLRESIIELNANISNLNDQLKRFNEKNEQDHKHFYKKINDHETRITVLEDHDDHEV